MKSSFTLGLVAASLLAMCAIAGCSGSDGTNGTNGQNGAPGAQGPAGPAGPAGSSGSASPSFGEAVPRVGFLDRSVDVVLSAAGVTLDNTATVDFGDPKITVDATKTQVISGSTLIVNITVDKATPVGAKDVTITLGANKLTGKGAFAVVAPIQVTADKPFSTTTSAAQGGFLAANLFNLDHTAFDPNALGVTGPGFVDTTFGITSTNATAIMLMDPLVTAGTAQLTVGNKDATGAFTTTWLSNTDAVTVTAGTPKAVVVGTPTTGESLQTELASNLYSFATAGVSIVHINIQNLGTSLATDGVAVHSYDKTGVSTGLLNVPQANGLFGPGPAANPIISYPVNDSSAETNYFVVSDLSFFGGATGYTYDVSVTTTSIPAANVIAETNTTANGHNTTGTAQALAAANLPAIVTGTLETSETFDVYSFQGTPTDLWELTYLESPNSFAQIAPDTTLANPNVQAAPFAANSASGIGAALGGTAAATWYVVVSPAFVSGVTASTPYAFSLRKTN